jgi:uncharacterized damage-inducible protein DinB
MTRQREEPPPRADERTTLVAALDHQRAILWRKCDGVPAERMVERAVPPSSLSLLGLVRHVADVERVWFRRRFAGEDVPLRYSTRDDPDRDFDDVRPEGVEEALAAWRAECDAARRIVAAARSLDALGRQPRRDEQWTLRWLLVHLVEEYARHNGHADLLRERIDGTVGD